MSWQRVLIDGGALCALGGALILASLWRNPRLWLQDFPEDIRRLVPAKTAQEKRESLVWGIPFLAMLVGVPATSCVLLARSAAGSGSFVSLFANAFAILLLFNLFDLVVIDWLIVCGLTPRFLVVPGTEGSAGYKDYRHHFRAFLIGTAGSAAIAVVVAAVVWGLSLRA